MKISVADKQISSQQSDKVSKSEREVKLLKLKKACQDFESIFIYYMLKSMRTSDTKSNMFGEGLGSDIFMQMFDQGLADKMSSTGQLDIARNMYSKYAALVGGTDDTIAQPTKAIDGPKPKIIKNTIAPHVSPAKNAITTDKQPVNSVKNVTTVPNPETAVPIADLDLPAVSISQPQADATSVADNTIASVTLSKKETRQKALVDKYHDIITNAATAYDIDPNLIKAVILKESGGNPNAISAKGAKGLMQIMDGTARMLGVTNPFDTKQNIEGGVKYLADLINRFEGNIENALAAYNAGPAAVQKYGGIPPYDETTDFVTSVMSYFNGLFNFDKSR